MGIERFRGFGKWNCPGGRTIGAAVWYAPTFPPYSSRADKAVRLSFYSQEYAVASGYLRHRARGAYERTGAQVTAAGLRAGAER
jgi:hypothetical protein